MSGYRTLATSLFLISCLVNMGLCNHEALFRQHKGKYLANNVIKSQKTSSELECTGLCARQGLCASVNYRIFGEDQGMCELNSKTLENSDLGDVVKDTKFVNLGIVKRDGVYRLVDNFAKHYPVYCHMSDIPGCGAEGWTLVMKIDGTKTTFGYDSPYWTNKNTYEVEDGLEGLTKTESKLESYWNTAFTMVCVGMKVRGDTRWVRLDYEATSLYSVFEDGQFRPTNLGRSAWGSLIDGSSLQENCNQEGFNHQGGVFIRLGILANNENNCNSTDSWIGFAVTHIVMVWEPYSITTGNYARYAGENGDRDTAAIGYILVA